MGIDPLSTDDAENPERKWEPMESLKVDWTEFETEGHSDNDEYDGWLTGPYMLRSTKLMREVLEVLGSLDRKVDGEVVKVSSESEAFKKANRYGVQESQSLASEYKIGKMAKAIQKFTALVPDSHVSSSRFAKDDSGRRVMEDGEIASDSSFRIIWYQMTWVNDGSDDLGVNKADLFRYQLYKLVSDLPEEYRHFVGPGVYRRCSKAVDRFEGYIKDRAEVLYDLMVSSVNEAIGHFEISGMGSIDIKSYKEAMQYLKTHFSGVYEKFEMRDINLVEKYVDVDDSNE